MWDDCPPSTRGSLLPGELPKLRNPDGPKIKEKEPKSDDLVKRLLKRHPAKVGVQNVLK
jgi:hypothetical protein